MPWSHCINWNTSLRVQHRPSIATSRRLAQLQRLPIWVHDVGGHHHQQTAFQNCLHNSVVIPICILHACRNWKLGTVLISSLPTGYSVLCMAACFCRVRYCMVIKRRKGTSPCSTIFAPSIDLTDSQWFSSGINHTTIYTVARYCYLTLQEHTRAYYTHQNGLPFRVTTQTGYSPYDTRNKPLRYMHMQTPDKTVVFTRSTTWHGSEPSKTT